MKNKVMNSIIKKISLALLASAVLFVQVKAQQDPQTIIDNLQVILDNVQLLKNIVDAKGSVNAQARRKPNQTIDSITKQLPKIIQNSLKSYLADFRKEMIVKNSSDFQRTLIELREAISQFKAKEEDTIAKEQAGAGYASRAWSATKSAASGAYYGVTYVPRRAGRAAKYAAEKAVAPIQWGVGKIVGQATSEQQEQAAMALEMIEPQIDTLMQEIAKLEQQQPGFFSTATTDPKNTSVIDFTTCKIRLAALNAEKVNHQVTLGEVNSTVKIALYTASAATAALIIGYLANRATDGQLKAVLMDPVGTAQNAHTKMVAAYDMIKNITYDDIKNALYAGKTGLMGTASNMWESTKNLGSNIKEEANYRMYGTQTTPEFTWPETETSKGYMQRGREAVGGAWEGAKRRMYGAPSAAAAAGATVATSAAATTQGVDEPTDWAQRMYREKVQSTPVVPNPYLEEGD